ncbi:ERAP1-like C-terminal domain-containing protein [Thalassotalea litorea]|uniref:ERAP1-like C-terminal domain-containing protein n=1 Tax=Thalassotalea litorea TaxID=2020715 RepID=UPI0037359DAA
MLRGALAACCLCVSAMPLAKALPGHNDLLSQKPQQQIHAIIDSRKALDTGAKTINDHLKILETLASTKHPATALIIIDEIISVGYVYLDERNLNAYAYFVNALLEPWLQKVGFKESPGQSYEIVYLRARMLRALAQFGRNKQAITYLQSLVSPYLKENSGISAELGTEALRVTAIFANRSQQDLVHRYFQVTKSTKNPELRKSVVQAMYFRDPTAIHYIFENTPQANLTSGERMYILQRLFWQNKQQEILYQWLEDDFGKWVANLPLLYQSVLPEVFTPSCQWGNAQALYDFFSEKRSIFQSSLQKQLRETAQCLQVKQLQKPLLNDFLVSYH